MSLSTEKEDAMCCFQRLAVIVVGRRVVLINEFYMMLQLLLGYPSFGSGDGPQVEFKGTITVTGEKVV